MESSYAIEDAGEAMQVDGGGDNAQEVEKANNNREEEKKKEDNGEVEKELDTALVLTRRGGSNNLLGQVVNSEEEAYRLYCDYGHRMGFSVRKGKQNYFSGTKNIRTKDYCCSKEGIRYDELPSEVNTSRPDYRTNCKAMVRFRVDEEGRWKVVRFVPEHNHDLAKPEERHLLRSARSSGKGKSGDAAGTPTTNAGSSRVEEGSGNEKVGSTKRSHYVSVQKMTVIEMGDSESLVGHFKRRANEEGMFYWDVQIDKANRMTNFFWRDGRSRDDYDSFGDVVVLDTSYRTSRYNMICASFLGVNHHWQNVMFGCAFLLDETKASFVWLFKSFLESMGDRPPKSIFTTDQDQAISEAIKEVFPNTSHRLCLWTLQKKALAHLGTLNSSRKFHTLFMRCIQECNSEMEFEETWAKMLRKHNLQDHQWLKSLHKIRHKWSSAFNKDAFDGGIELPQRGESPNNVLNGIADKSASLTEFVLAFEKLVEGWRKNEAEEDYRCHRREPLRAIKHSDILKHAGQIYTHKIYKVFENEFLDGCGATSVEETACGGTLFRFELKMQGRGLKACIVILDTSTLLVSCSCKKFETMGILCSHALKAFSLKNVDRIPERYILKRWTKEAKKGLYKLIDQDESLQQECKEAELAFCYHAMRYAYNLVMKSQWHDESRKLLWDAFETGEDSVEKFIELQKLHAHFLRSEH
ncbi:protein FAR1-RELATED SEQUENCE 5-like [Ananas comosus]|uniref:Protein FAR1-RELATED SEQUENCE 5-like n=2 Tax=Ananas comosus TaxID=4615 RepID=A0A6P5GY20_ANACO|nr:protein FAR1-RELATED SEQUENCE 5-like [Ananas comosus]